MLREVSGSLFFLDGFDVLVWPGAAAAGAIPANLPLWVMRLLVLLAAASIAGQCSLGED
jgi:hypothetical protein